MKNKKQKSIKNNYVRKWKEMKGKEKTMKEKIQKNGLCMKNKKKLNVKKEK